MVEDERDQTDHWQVDSRFDYLWEGKNKTALESRKKISKNVARK